MTIVEGVIWVYSNGANIAPAPEFFRKMTSIKVFGNMPLTIFIWIGIGVLAALMLKWIAWPQLLRDGQQRSVAAVGHQDGQCKAVGVRPLRAAVRICRNAARFPAGCGDSHGGGRDGADGDRGGRGRRNESFGRHRQYVLNVPRRRPYRHDQQLNQPLGRACRLRQCGHRIGDWRGSVDRRAAYA